MGSLKRGCYHSPSARTDNDCCLTTLRAGQGQKGGFEVDNSRCHLNDQWMKIEAVMDTGAAESVAPADMAPWVPI